MYIFSLFAPEDILIENIETASNIFSGYDRLWSTIYTQDNALWSAVMTLAEYVLCFAIVDFSTKLLEHLLYQKYAYSVRRYIWGIIVAILLANNGYYLAPLIQSLRHFCYDQIQVVYQVQVKDILFGDAIKDVLITKDLKRKIEKQFADCEVKTGQEQVECVKEVVKKVKREIKKIKREIIKKGLRAEGVGQIDSQLTTMLSRLEIRDAALLRADPNDLKFYADKIYANPLISSAAKGLVFAILKGFQWGFSQCMELGQLLTGLSAPIAVALSLYELPFPPLLSWLMGFITIGIISWSYALMVGVVCWVMVIQGMQSYSDLGFLLFLSIGSPALSIYIANRGGAVIYENFLQAGVTIARIASSSISECR